MSEPAAEDPASQLDALVTEDKVQDAVSGSSAAKAADEGVDQSAPKAPEPSPNDQTTGHSKQRGKFKSNNRFDPKALPDTDDPAEIRKQVEFYFSDSNLPNDKYMLQMTGGEKNTPMKLKTICGFKRMHRFKPYSAVVAALRDSKLLCISGPEGDEEVKRNEPYSPSSRDEGKELAATVYVKGFGDEQPSTVFDIEAWFVKYGPINAVRLRRHQDKQFKGSVFVEFQSEELAQQFLTLEPRPQWQGRDLIIMSKKAYLEEKEKQEASKRPGRGDKIDPRDWKKRRELDQKNGFRNQRGGGRGGRGRGGGHDRDRSRKDQSDEAKQPAAENEDAGTSEKPSNPEAKKEETATVEGHTATNGKRARDEDDNADGPPVKKADTKNGASTTEA